MSFILGRTTSIWTSKNHTYSTRTNLTSINIKKETKHEFHHYLSLNGLILFCNIKMAPKILNNQKYSTVESDKYDS